MAEFLTLLLRAPFVWIGQQRNHWRTRPRFNSVLDCWICRECGMMHFRRDSATACDHGKTETDS